MKGKCAWSGKWSERTIALKSERRFVGSRKPDLRSFKVLPEYVGALEGYLDKLYRIGPRLSLFIAFGIFLYLLSGLFNVRWLGPYIMVTLGTLLVIFPYSTTILSIEAFGARNIKVLTRIGGLIGALYGLYGIWTLLAPDGL